MTRNLVTGLLMGALILMATNCGGGTTAPPPLLVPTIASIAPTDGPLTGGTPVTIMGTNFDGNGTQVTIGGAAATAITVVSGNQVDCTTPPGVAGPADVTVTTAGGSDTLIGAFTYVPAPTLTAVSPPQGPALGGTTLTLTGTGFSVPGATVTVDGVAAVAVTVVNDTTITCDTPPGTPQAVVDVAVNTAGGTATLAASYTYLDAWWGTYHVGNFLGTNPPETSVTGWGTMTADGLGMVIGTALDANADGLVAPLPFPPFPYAIGTGGALTIESGAPGVDNMAGGISTDGRMLLLGTILAGDPPNLVLGLRRDGTFDSMSINGTYNWAMFYDSIPGAGGDGAFWGTITFNGAAGTFTSSYDVNSGGAVIPGMTTAGTYTVLADGTFTLFFGGMRFQGGILEGGDVAFTSGGDLPGNVRGLSIFLRQPTAASDATFTGPYHYVGINADTIPGGLHWATLTGGATADGLGTVTLNTGTAIGDDGSIFILPGATPSPYTVAADGTLISPAVMQGGISASGDIAFWAGNTTAGDMSLWVFLR